MDHVGTLWRPCRPGWVLVGVGVVGELGSGKPSCFERLT